MKMKGKNIVNELIQQRDYYKGPGKFRFHEEAKKYLLGRTIKIKYPNGEIVTVLITDIYASGLPRGLFAIRTNEGKFHEIFESTEIMTVE